MIQRSQSSGREELGESSFEEAQVPSSGAGPGPGEVPTPGAKVLSHGGHGPIVDETSVCQDNSLNLRPRGWPWRPRRG